MAIPYSTLYQIVASGGSSVSGQSSPYSQLVISVAVAAQAILVEDEGTALHASRLTWAQRTLSDVEGMAKKMLWGVVADPNVQNAYIATNVTDAIVQTSVNTLVNGYLNA